ncbi:MAG: glycerol-3-phosphate 1-O-acyltransferase PlsY [Desulfobulbaceae bacterium]|nr:glycerol-3-phosphate 1-O-acyltransferase PlsY [Desulfobulbaceae bacterium]
MTIFLLILASYLIGALPFGLFIGKLAGVDVRKEGSGNIGATNVNRLLGKRLGTLTLVCDVLKSYLPMLAANFIVHGQPKAELWVAVCGLAAVVGHIFPIYLQFKGGKGVATALGMFLFLSPMAVGLALLCFLMTVWCSGFVSAGSLAAATVMPIMLWLGGESVVKIIACLPVVALIWLKHHENIRRLLRGEEKSWRGAKKS